MKEENELTRRLYGTHDGHRKLQPSSLSKSFVPKKKGLRKSSSTLLPSLPKKEYTTSLTTSASAQALFDDSIQEHHTIGVRPLPIPPAQRRNKNPTDNNWTDAKGSSEPFGTFTASLCLDPRYLKEFHQGNFIYLAQQKGAGKTMYDLQIMEHYEITRNNYYTMSKSGLTHFTANESEFTPLDTWEREYCQFVQMRKIRFFYLYKTWKNFMLWKRNIRASHVHYAKCSLNANLFLLHPHLSSSLQQIRQACFSIATLKLMEFEESNSVIYTQETFTEAQRLVRISAISAVQDFSSTLLQIAQQACNTVVDTFLENNHISADHKMTFMERAALRKECHKLSRFLRLSDFLAIHSTLSMALSSMEHVLTVFRQRSSGTLPLFTVQVTTSHENKLQVTPNVSAFGACLENVLKDALLTIDSPVRLLGHPSLTTFTEASSEGGTTPSNLLQSETTVGSMLNINVDFVEFTTSIFSILETSFEKVDEVLESYDVYQEAFQRNALERPTYRTKYATTTVDEYEKILIELENQRQFFHGFPSSTIVSLMQVDSTLFRDSLLPSTVDCLSTIREVIPILMTTSSDSLITELEQYNRSAISHSINVEEFVDKLSNMDSINVLVPQLSLSMMHIKSLYSMLEEHDWTINDHIKENMILMKENMLSLEENVARFDGEKDEETIKFISCIEDEIVFMNKDIVKCREKLDHSCISNPFSLVETVVHYLKKEIEIEIQNHLVRSRVLQEFQIILGQEENEFENLDEVFLDLKMKMSLWSCKQEWQIVQNRVETCTLPGVNVIELKKTVIKYNSIAIAADHYLPSNACAQELCETLMEWSRVVPLLEDLTCDSLQEQHWQAIMNVFHYDIKNDLDLTIKGLMELQRGEEDASDVRSIVALAQMDLIEVLLEEMMQHLMDNTIPEIEKQL